MHQATTEPITIDQLLAELQVLANRPKAYRRGYIVALRQLAEVPEATTQAEEHKSQQLRPGFLGPVVRS